MWVTPSVRPSVRRSQQGYQNGREMSSRTVFVLSGDLTLPNDNRKKYATSRFHDGMVSKTWLKQHHETDILAQESPIWRSEQNRSILAQILRPVEPRGPI